MLLSSTVRARGIIVRDLVTGEIQSHAADAVVLATGGYVSTYFHSTNAINSNCTAIWRAHKRGAGFRQPLHGSDSSRPAFQARRTFQCKLTLMSESLRNDGRCWVPRKKGDDRHPAQIPEEDRYYYLEERYPSYGNLVPRDVASRNAKYVCDDGFSVLGRSRGGPSIWTSVMPSSAKVARPLVNATATSSTCITRSRTKVPMTSP